MAENLQISALVKINPGKLEQFKAAGQECIDLVQANEIGTNTLYDWFLSADGTTCEVREEYVDSPAFLKHLGNVKVPLDKVLEHGDLVIIKIYGNPSQQLLAAIEGLPAEVYSLM